MIKIFPRRRPLVLRISRQAWHLLLPLVVAAYFLIPTLRLSAANSYDPLRLYTEALFEISQKYVWPKNEEDMVYGSLRGMMNSLDPDSSFLTPKEYQAYVHGEKGQPAEAGLELIVKDSLLTVVSVIDNSPAAKAGLKPGDHILKLDGHLIRNITTQEAARRFKGAPGTKVKVQVMRNGAIKPLDLTVTLEPLAVNTVTSRILDNSIAYIRIRYFNDETPAELATVVKNLKQQQGLRGIILDLRNNARGSMEDAVRSASVFVGDQVIVLSKGRTPESEQRFSGKSRDLVLKPLLPMVVLMDEGTGRAAEIVAGALRDDARATLLGAKSIGLCGITKALPLQDGSGLLMTVAFCYTPKGQKIQGKGLEPDVPGQVAKGAKGEEKEPPQVQAVAPDQDPWVRQAVDLLKFGKPRQIAKSGENK